MKKVMCIILVIAMMLGFIAMLAVETFAESYDEAVTLNTNATSTALVAFQLPDIYAGDAIDPNMSIGVDGGTVASSLKWTDKWGDPLSETVFQADKYYAFTVTINAPEGAPYAEHMDFEVNRDYYGVSRHYGDYGAYLEVTVEIYVEEEPTGVVIDRLDFYLPTLTPGETIPSAPQISVNNPNVTWQQRWGDEFGENIPTGTFQAGEKYWMTARVTVDAGYIFDDELVHNWEGKCYGATYSTSADYTCFTISFLVECTWEELERIELSDLPESISVGAATVPAVTVVRGQATVTGVQWVDASKQPVTAFQNGKAYFLEVTVKPQAGYSISNWTDIYAENKWPNETVRESDQLQKAYYRYSLLGQVDTLRLQLNDPSLGMEINQLSVTVLEGEVIVMPVKVCDPITGMPVEEPTLLDKKTYALWYSFMPKEGYEFNDNFVDVTVENCDFELQWSHDPESLIFCRYFSTCTPIEQVQVNVSPVAVGGVIDEVTVTVPTDANYTLESFDIYGYSDDHESADSDRFQENFKYSLNYYLVPKDGYVFTYDTKVKVGDTEANFHNEQGGLRLYGWKEYAFTVEEIFLRDLPNTIEAGQAEIPPVRLSGDQVRISDVKWVDASKQQTVTQFEEGKSYFLAVTVDAVAPRKFVGDPQLDINWSELHGEFVKRSDTQAVVYVPYSLLPDAGDLRITVTGLQVGKDVSELTATVAGNATVESIAVFDHVYDPEDRSYSNIPMESGKLEKGHNYNIMVSLRPAEGYRFKGEGLVTVNGKDASIWGMSDDTMNVVTYYSTCEQITSAKVTMTTPAAGKDAPAPKVDSSANYTVEYQWYDETDGYMEHSGKLVKGHVYNLYICLRPKTGYAFADDCAITLNGQKERFYISSEGGIYADLGQRYSFREKISKIELPAMPKSISKGDTLSAEYTVSGKNYTLTADWMRFNGGEPVGATKADWDDVYVLTFNVQAKTGYEFTDDCKIYLNGKEADEIYQYAGGDYASVSRIFFVNYGEIQRVDVTVPKLEEGVPPYVTVPGDANYTLAEWAWAENSDGDFRNDHDIVEQLHKGKFVYLGMMLEPKEGYAFNKLEFYVNGKKVEPVVVENGATQAIVFLPMGKLGEIEKLTAPKVEVQGNGIAWEAVLNADAYEIYRATSKSGKYTKVDAVTDTSWQDTALAKTYYYKVKAIYSADTSKSSSYSNTVSVKFLLDAPVITMGMDEKLGKAIISWDAVEGAKSYEIWRATSETGKYTRISTTKASVLTYTDKYASVGTQYYYKVRAVASSSTYNSPYSNILSATSVCAQAKLTAKMDTATGKPVISWAKVDGAENYWLLRREAGSDTSYTVISRQTKLTYLDTTAVVDVEYEYILDVIGKTEELDGITSEPVTIACGLAKPVVKGAITGQGKPQLTWDAVEGAVKYEVYRSTKSNKGYTLLGEAYSTGVDDMSAAVGKTYYYKIVAVGENGKSPESSYVKLTGKCATPMVLAENAASGKPKLSWGKVDGAKQYTVYRASSETGKYSKLGTTKSLYYEDKKASSGKTYFYKVIANGSKSSYNSGYSDFVSCNVICGTPSVTVKVDIATGKPSLSWKKVDAAAGYRIFRMLPGEETFTVIAEQTGVTFIDTTAPIDTQCIYKVQTVGKIAELDGVETKELSVTSAIAQPKLSSGVNADGKPHFNWQPIEGAVKYEVYRSTKSSKGYTLLATVEDGNAYVDETVAGGKTFYYKVKAIGEVSSSESSYVKLTGKCAAPWISIDTTSGKPVLSWEKVSGAKQYTVYRATSMEGKYTKLGTTKKLTYTDSKAKTGGEYYYKVIANGSKSSYNSIYSNVKMALVPCAAPKVTVKNNALGQPVLSWGKVSGAKQYKIVYQLGYLGTGGYGCEVCEECDICEYYSCEGCECEGCICTNPDAGKTVVYTESTSYTLTDADVDMVGWVEVTAIAENELLSSAPGEAQVAVLPATPKLTGKVGENGKPVISWVDNGDAVIYEIYRSTKKSSGYKLIDEVENMGEGEDFEFVPEYEDTTAKKDKTYYYKVVAKSWNSESAMSSYVKVKSK